MTEDGELPSPAAFFCESRAALRDTCRDRPLLDLACGRGRHALAAAREGLRSLALDRNHDFLRALAGRARGEDLPLQPVRFDLEVGVAPPLRAHACGAVLVFRYLHRPLAPEIARLLAPAGLLVYETFTTAQRGLGTGPRNPAFLLEPGELPGLFPGLEPLRFEEGLHEGAMTARLLARAPA